MEKTFLFICIKNTLIRLPVSLTCIRCERVPGKRYRAQPRPQGGSDDDNIYYYGQNPSGFSFLVQITAFVLF